MYLVFWLGWENDVDGFFLYNNESDAAEMCLSLAQEELEEKYNPQESSLLDSCWFVTKCQYIQY